TAVKALEDAGVSDAEENVWVGGATATLYDTEEITSRDQAVIIPILLIIIATLLLIYLRSIVAMTYLLGTLLFSYCSALRLGWTVSHDFRNVPDTQGLIPLCAFVFLVVLGEDYNIFRVSSIWNKRNEMPFNPAIQESVGETGSVISSAG